MRAVLDDGDYAEFVDRSGPVPISVIGYSQGGHSAIAVAESVVSSGWQEVTLERVYAGAGPYNLYQTVRGVVVHVDGSCNGGAYCRYVDAETTVPFATDRVMPGYVEYLDTGLGLADVVDGGTLAGGFVSAFLDNSADLDSLKLALQQSSFTNVLNPAAAYGGSAARVVLYHSPFDRLVAEANTEELAAVLEPSLDVDYRAGLCSGDAYESIFLATDFVGINHALCGLAMVNDVLDEY